jgi:hypothetical protein
VEDFSLVDIYKKQTMNKKLLLSILLVIFVMQGYSRDIYMYNGTNVVQTIPNIRKITFSDKTMCVEQSKGTVTSVNLSDFNNFSFFKRNYPDAINTIVSGSASCGFDGKTLTVRHAQCVNVLSLQGVQLIHHPFLGNEARISLDNLPAGLYLVEIIANDKTYTHKILKK